MILSILSFIFVFFILVFFHELGHFFMAKLYNIKVNEFFLGFGPAFFQKKYGETLYTLRIFPLGGAVALLGENLTEEMSEKDKKRAFSSQKLWKQFSVVFMGPFMNFVVAIVIMCLLGLSSGKVQTTTISDITNNSPAMKYGLNLGDKIIEINKNKINSWYDIIQFIAENKDNELNFLVLRDNNKKYIKVVPEYLENENRYIVGFSCINSNPFVIIKEAFKTTINMGKQILEIIPKLFYDKEVQQSISGPVSIYKVVDRAAKTNFGVLMEITALISINLGVMNLLPIPALDGGRLFFLLVAMILKPFNVVLNPKYEEIIHGIGFILLLILTIVLVFKDIFFPTIVPF